MVTVPDNGNASQMTRISTRVALRIANRFGIALLCLVPFCLAQCSNDDEVDEAIRQAKFKADTIGRLGAIKRCIIEASFVTHQPPPTSTSAKALIAWLAKGDPAVYKERFVSADRERLLDSWGTDLILVTDGKKLVQIGSCGPNRKWDGGGADDIVEPVKPTEYLYEN